MSETTAHLMSNEEKVYGSASISHFPHSWTVVPRRLEHVIVVIWLVSNNGARVFIFFWHWCDSSVRPGFVSTLFFDCGRKMWRATVKLTFVAARPPIRYGGSNKSARDSR